jgi:phosphoglycolate phosphatase-like HAD superfamily hydrolase
MKISHVIFDFDGTLSWLRHGWPEIMMGLFREFYPSHGEPEEIIRPKLQEIALGMNGKPTILQMQRFRELSFSLGGQSPEAEVLRAEYQRRLDQRIAARTASIVSGESQSDDYVVHGGRAFLEALQKKGLVLIVLSTTLEERVREEARILQLHHYFGSHLYGGRGDPGRFSKKAVIERLMAEESILGESLLSFGDGPVEIADTKEAGGLAIGVASDENQNGSGRMDPWKKQQLKAAGADAVIADFRDLPGLLTWLER